MSRKTDRTALAIYMIVGGLALMWVGAKIAPFWKLGLFGLLTNGAEVFADPFHLEYCSSTLPVILFIEALYAAGLCTWFFSMSRFRRGEEYGSAKWGSPKVISSMYTDKKNPMQNLLLSQNVSIGSSAEKIYEHGRNINVIVVGGSGAGKTRGYVIPNLLQASMSYVALDPSGEILRATGNFMESQGYKVRVLNLFQMEQSDGYNPFMYLRNEDDVDRMVTNYWEATKEKGAAKGEQIWDDTAKELLAAVCYYLYYFAPPEEQNFAMVLFMVRNMQGEDSPVGELFAQLEKRDPENLAAKHYRSYNSGSEKTLQSIQITLLSRLGKFDLASVEKLSSGTEDELKLYDIPKEKTVLYAITPVADTSLNFFVSLLYTQLFEILYDYGNTHGHIEYPLHFLMDEFANVTLPESFENRLATFRKYWISASVILQNLSQLKALFKDNWESIVGNADEFLYLGGNETSTHEYVSKRLGKETIALNTYGQSKGRQGSFSKNEQLTGRELLTPDEVGKLKNKYCILFIRGEDAILDRKINLMQHPNIKYTTYGKGKAYNREEKKIEQRVLEESKPMFTLIPASQSGYTQEELDAMPELDLETGEIVYPRKKIF